jgi:hypothetical protein
MVIGESEFVWAPHVLLPVTLQDDGNGAASSDGGSDSDSDTSDTDSGAGGDVDNAMQAILDAVSFPTMCTPAHVPMSIRRH